MRTLGVTRRVADDELGPLRGTSVRLEWLLSKIFNAIDADTEVRIKCAVRAYLLYLIGCTLFSDKGGTRFSVSYVSLFEDIGTVSTCALGTATLTYLYRQFGYSSRGDVKQIAGYLPLPEVLLAFNACFKKKLATSIILILEMFETDMDIRALSYYATSHNMEYMNDLPRACMWGRVDRRENRWTSYKQSVNRFITCEQVR